MYFEKSFCILLSSSPMLRAGFKSICTVYDFPFSINLLPFNIRGPETPNTVKLISPNSL